MDYLLDSNIAIIYSRDNEIAHRIEEEYRLFSVENRLAISVVFSGEISATIKKLNLGKKRRDRIEDILNNINEFDISFREVIERYAEIDAYSQGKLKTKKGKFSARNMGKNDIWIAATASVFNLTLVLSQDKIDE